MKLIRACMIAFSMYSKIPMPQIEWEKDSMKYVMCFFPWVGAVIGGCFYLWGIWGGRFLAGSQLYAVLLTVIPVLLTGGIHLDGFLDTTDAISSWQSRERRLEILKDSHTGAFAVIGACVYFLLYFGLASELEPEKIPVAALGFFLSRCLSGYAVASFPCARDSGLAAMFSNAADKKCVKKVLFCQAIIFSAWIMRLDMLAGGALILVSLLVFLWYYRMSMDKFGGITGDLAGWFLQVCELLQLAAVVFAGKFQLYHY